MSGIVVIRTPAEFNFSSCLRSHGWVNLAPFEVMRNVLKGVLRLDGSIARIEVSQSSEGKLVAHARKKTGDSSGLKNAVTRIFRLDEDLSGFYNIAKNDAELEWVARIGAGRLVRSPTVWEDLVKTLCTTNCSWGLTLKMVSNLVEKLGESDRHSDRAFPTPDAMAAVDEEFYRNEIRAGYRAPYFLELSKRVCDGELDPESWLSSELATNELKRDIKGVKGIGDYAAENLLKLVGRYEGLALDSWLRARFYMRFNDGKPCPDGKIEEHYARYGEWKGLAIWCDMSRDWHLQGQVAAEGV